MKERGLVNQSDGVDPCKSSLLLALELPTKSPSPIPGPSVVHDLSFRLIGERGCAKPHKLRRASFACAASFFLPTFQLPPHFWEVLLPASEMSSRVACVEWMEEGDFVGSRCQNLRADFSLQRLFLPVRLSQLQPQKSAATMHTSDV